MASLIVKDGSLCVSNGHLVTDADGAPCVCDGDPPNDDWPCDGPRPECYLVELSGWSVSGCEVTTGCFVVPDIGLVFVDGEAIQAEGFNGTHYYDVSGVNSYYCSVIVQGTINPDLVGVAYERFGINITYGCDLATDQLGITSISISSEGGGACNDGLMFAWNADTDEAAPFGTTFTPSDNRVIVDCESLSTSRHVKAGSVTITPVDCTGAPPETYYAFNCETHEDIITVDITNRPANHTTILVGGDRYKLTGIRSDESPVAGVWDNLFCSGASRNVIAIKCSNANEQISIDPTTNPGNGVTVLYNGDRYTPLSLETSLDPVAVVWSTDGCFGTPPGPGDVCSTIAENDPRCVNPAVRDCPQCNNFRIPGAGDFVAGAIKIATLGLVKPCTDCQHRQEKLNNLGRSLNERIKRALGG
jgi:hypothetical protein